MLSAAGRAAATAVRRTRFRLLTLPRPFARTTPHHPLSYYCERGSVPSPPAVFYGQLTNAKGFKTRTMGHARKGATRVFQVAELLNELSIRKQSQVQRVASSFGGRQKLVGLTASRGHARDWHAVHPELGACTSVPAFRHQRNFRSRTIPQLRGSPEAVISNGHSLGDAAAFSRIRATRPPSPRSSHVDRIAVGRERVRCRVERSLFHFHVSCSSRIKPE